MSASNLFKCPNSMAPHVQKVFDGEYDIDGLEAPKVVLDVGANYGAFTLKALKDWPECQVYAYEPCSKTFFGLLENLRENAPSAARATAYQVAVSSKGEHAYLYYGRNNPGEASLYKLGEQMPHGERVACLSPRELPKADFLKIDAEGAEWDVLSNYSCLDSLQAVALEWHIVEDTPKIIDLLNGAGFAMRQANPSSRVLKFIRV